jgi:hypothetical protein
VRLKVRPRKPFLRGTPVRLPFTVTGEPPGSAARSWPRGPTALAPPDPSRPVLEGAVEQRPVISRGLLNAALLIVLPLALLAGYLLRLPDVSGAGKDDAAPTGLALVTTSAIAADTMKVSWTAVDRATGYEVVPIDAKSGAEGRAQDVPGGTVAFQDVTVDPEQRTACFAVRAMRGALQGKLSKPACAKAVKETLPAPSKVEAGFNADGTLRVTWVAATEGLAHRVFVDGAAQDVLPGGTTLAAVPVPAGEKRVCVIVQAVDGKKLSPMDADGASACVPRPPGPTGDTGDGTNGNGSSGTTTPDVGTKPVSAWVAQVGAYYPDPVSAQAALDAAISAGYPARRLRILSREDLVADQTLTPAARVVAVDGFADKQAADTYCTNEAPRTSLACVPLETGQR